MLNAQVKQSAVFGFCIALVFSLVLSIVFTGWNWIENPGGIFRDDTGVSWDIVADTAMSWLVPAFWYSFPVASIFHFFVRRLIERRG